MVAPLSLVEGFTDTPARSFDSGCFASVAQDKVKRWLVKPTARLPGGGGSAAATRPPAVQDEVSRLDDAINRADDLLVSSLKRDEWRRRRRRWIALSVGGLAMLATL